MTITDEAIEAAARALNPWAMGFDGYNSYVGYQQDQARKNARAALTAALPFIAEGNFEADARRYRFLRNANLDTIESGGLFIGETPSNTILTEEDADRAIDTAIRNEPIGGE